MLQSFEPDEEYAKRDLHFGQIPEQLLQMRLHHDVAGYSGDFIDTAREILFPVIETGSPFLLFKNLHPPDD